MIKINEINEEIVERVIDSFPVPVLIVDEDVRILGYNDAARDLVGPDASIVLRERGGEVLKCLHSFNSPQGCGTSEQCRKCALRNAVNQAFEQKHVIRIRHKMEQLEGGETKPVYLLVTARPFKVKERLCAIVILEDINELVELQKLIPICAVCKKVRTDKNYWVQVEFYLSKHLDIMFTHGLCPTCYEAQRALFRETCQQTPTAPSSLNSDNQEASLHEGP